MSHQYISAAYALVLFITSSLLTGCGGGGGSSEAPSSAASSSEVFQVQNAWINYLINSASSPFTLTGTTSGVPVTGSGTATFGQLAGATFEGRQAMSKSTSITGSLSANGQTIPLSTTSTTYVDTNYNLLGRSSQSEYSVVSSYVTLLTNAAKVNDTAILYTENRYTNSSKSVKLGTSQTSYVLEPDTAQTAILKLITIKKNNQGTVESNSIEAYRITPSGALIRLYESTSSSTTNLTVSY